MFLAIFGALLLSCSEEEIANVKTSSRNVIGFNVLGSMAETKATPINSSNLKTEDFGVFCYTTKGDPFMGTLDENYNHNGVRIGWNDNLNKWYYRNSSDLHYWPVDVLNFYAIYPGTTIGRSDEHYEWEFNATFQGVHYKCLDEFNTDLPNNIQLRHTNHDVMCGIAKGQVYETNNGVVKFHFKHILSQVVFKAKKKLENMEVTIKDIKLHNIKQGGTFTYPDVEYTKADVEISRDCWSNVNESDTYSPYIIKGANISIGIDDTDITVSGNTPSLLIPQKMTAWTVSDNDKKSIAEADNDGQSYLEIICKFKQNGKNLAAVDSEDYATLYMPFTADWMPGKRYVYTLIFGGGYDADGNAILDPIKFDADVEEWADEIHGIDY